MRQAESNPTISCVFLMSPALSVGVEQPGPHWVWGLAPFLPFRGQLISSGQCNADSRLGLILRELKAALYFRALSGVGARQVGARWRGKCDPSLGAQGDLQEEVAVNPASRVGGSQKRGRH